MSKENKAQAVIEFVSQPDRTFTIELDTVDSMLKQLLDHAGNCINIDFEAAKDEAFDFRASFNAVFYELDYEVVSCINAPLPKTQHFGSENTLVELELIKEGLEEYGDLFKRYYQCKHCEDAEHAVDMIETAAILATAA
ncbi:hypothetical protein [Piscirickettsia litoralis]|uniref:Histidine kinase n=1 Tax=Piscirickettsia litoralis TaxID=1891921 RepID=A0ABX3A0H2_9GAMM|nr:hypothetical protein [Piscirickettsia litoralis]ODN41196.1 hypothetical protein BGC07_17435 [Piscirickettsia litoralis]